MKNKITLLCLLAMVSFFSVSGQQVRSVESIGVDQVIVMELGNNGDVWLGTAGAGAKHYNDSTKTWSTFNKTTNPALPSDTITAIVFGLINGKQYAFFGTPSGLAYSRNDTVFAIAGLMPAETNITALALTPGDTLIAFTTGAGAVAFDARQARIGKSPVPCTHMAAAQGTANSYTCTTGLTAGSADSGACYTTDYINYTLLLSPNLVSDSVTQVFLDRTCGARFIGTRQGFSNCPDGFPCTNYTTDNGLPQNYITAISQNCKGEVWIGTHDSGIVILNIQTQQFTRVTMANGLTTNQITAIAFLIDSCTGTGYVGTADGNVAIVDSANTVVQILSSIKDVDANNFNTTLYPQPASNQVNFLFENEVKNGQFCITDINGRALGYYNLKNTNKFTLDISNLAAGLYVYKILENGQMVKAGRVEVLR